MSSLFRALPNPKRQSCRAFEAFVPDIALFVQQRKQWSDQTGAVLLSLTVDQLEPDEWFSLG